MIPRHTISRWNCEVNPSFLVPIQAGWLPGHRIGWEACGVGMICGPRGHGQGSCLRGRVIPIGCEGPGAGRGAGARGHGCRECTQHRKVGEDFGAVLSQPVHPTAPQTLNGRSTEGCHMMIRSVVRRTGTACTLSASHHASHAARPLASDVNRRLCPNGTHLDDLSGKQGPPQRAGSNSRKWPRLRWMTGCSRRSELPRQGPDPPACGWWTYGQGTRVPSRCGQTRGKV